MDTSDIEKQDSPEVYEFGWWPEVAGLLGVIGLIAYLILFARGSF